MSVIVKDSLARIAISKNLIKEYKTSDCERTVYLNNGTEFQIYLKNPYQYHLGIKIYVNDKSIGNMLVLRPGQSYWLDRYVDNDNKFLFSTYEIENSYEMKYATNKNGKVRIEFYREKEDPVLVFNSSPLTVSSYYYDGKLTNTICDTLSNTTCLDSNQTYSNKCFDSATLTASAISKGLDIDKYETRSITDSTIETGRVEKGSKSDQKFENCDISFEYSSFRKEDIQILPNSRKQIRVEEVRRKYCSQCGKKVSPKDKFCSNCGAKL